MSDESYGDDEFVSGEVGAEDAAANRPHANDVTDQLSAAAAAAVSWHPSLPAPPPLTQSPRHSPLASAAIRPSLADSSSVRVNRHAGGLRSLNREEKQTIQECKKSIKEDPSFVEPYVSCARGRHGG
jgi:hypothetical protein